MGRPKTEKGKRAIEIVRRKQVVRDEAARVRKVAEHHVQTWVADMECPHGHLAGDPWPHCCNCFEAAVNTAWEKVAAEVRELRAVVEAQNQTLETLKEMLAHTDRNVSAVGFQVAHTGDNGR